MIYSILLFAARRSRLSDIENLDGVGLCIVFGLVAMVVVGALLDAYFKQKKALRQQQTVDEHHKLQYRQWHNRIAMSGELVPIMDSPLMLSDGEELLWAEMRVTLFEVRAVRHSNHSFGSMPIGKTGIRIGKAYGTSESTDEWRPIAEGQLYITNKQIYFDGDKQDRKIPFSKISTVKGAWSAIEVSSETRQKSMVFMGVNGKICQEIIHLIKNESED